jgi:hypothetical protein
MIISVIREKYPLIVPLRPGRLFLGLSLSRQRLSFVFFRHPWKSRHIGMAGKIR